MALPFQTPLTSLGIHSKRVVPVLNLGLEDTTRRGASTSNLGTDVEATPTLDCLANILVVSSLLSDVASDGEDLALVLDRQASDRGSQVGRGEVDDGDAFCTGVEVGLGSACVPLPLQVVECAFLGRADHSVGTASVSGTNLCDGRTNTPGSTLLRQL